MKLVSVVIPCYRDSATLGRAIRSVLAQTYRPIEVVVVNDCSPETVEIEGCLTEFPEVRYLRNERNLGLAATRNAGLVAATGDCVAFLDADDEYHPRKIEYQMCALCPGSAVTCRFQEVLPGDSAPIASIRDADVAVSEVSTVGRLLYRNTLNGAGLLAPRELLLKMGGYDASMRSCEDFDLWLRLLESGVQARRVELPLYLYYFNPAGLSKNYLNISRWELEAIGRHMARRTPEVRRQWRYGFLLAYWLIKHFFRSERFSSEELRRVTLDNTAILAVWPVIGILVRCIGHRRLLAPPARLLAFASSTRGGVS